MTTTPFTITTSANNAFSSAVDQAVQYREAWLSVWLGIVSLADAIVRTCNGVATSATNNILTTSDVVFGTAASQAHSWGIARFGVEYIVWEANGSNADTTPQN